MVCGEEVLKNCSDIVEENTKVINSCSYDYIISKEFNKKDLDFKYIVFLDEYLINHTDFKILNKRVEEEDLYYKDLNRFFEFIETNLKLKVVITSHPRADLEYNKSKFSKYLVFKDNTSKID